jgi:hypothetical protein
LYEETVITLVRLPAYVPDPRIRKTPATPADHPTSRAESIADQPIAIKKKFIDPSAPDKKNYRDPAGKK